jgi:CheY-like chemotaxis protein
MKTEKATVLIVDDEPELREIFSLWLHREGYTVMTAADGAEALALLASNTVDALISDIRMPVMDGLTLLRSVFAMRRVLPSILFVSGFSDVDAREMYALGVEAMITKPLTRTDLLRALEASLQTRAELWLAPAVVGDAVALSFDGIEAAVSGCEFSLGRGGVCVPCSRSFVKDGLIDLSVEFVRDGLRLQGQGYVRWCSLEDQRMGVEFVYLDPACRDWVIPRMEGRTLFAFIPNCGAT